MKDKFYNFFRIIQDYALYGVLFFLAISNALVESFVGLMLLGFIGRKILKPDFKYLKFWPNISLLFFLLFSALSLFNSGQYLDKSVHALLGKWMQFLGICIIVQDNIYDQRTIKRGLSVFLFGAFLAVFSGLSQYFWGVEFLRTRNIFTVEGNIRAITSSFVHYNAFAGYLVVVLSLLISLLLMNNSFDFKTISLSIFTMFSIAAIILSFSRGGWVGLTASFILLFILSGRRFKRLIPIIFVIIIMFLFSAFFERMLFTFKAGGDGNRFTYWLRAVKMINEHPFFGVGVGTFMANFSKYSPSMGIPYAHNCYLQIWAETGIFSLISFMIFVTSIIHFGIKKFFASSDPLLLGLLAGLVGFLVHSFFEVHLYSLRLAILFWVWVGLLIARSRGIAINKA